MILKYDECSNKTKRLRQATIRQKIHTTDHETLKFMYYIEIVSTLSDFGMTLLSNSWFDIQIINIEFDVTMTSKSITS